MRWASPLHRLQLLQGLAIERRVGRLRDAVLVRRRGLPRRLDMPLRIGRKIKKGQVFLLVAGIDHVGLMTAKFRPVEEEPEEDQVRDEGDPHSFTAARLRTFVFKPVNQVQEFIRLQLFVARPLTSEERLRRPAGRAGWNFS